VEKSAEMSADIHDSLKIPVAFGLGEASAGGENCSSTSLHLKLLRASLGDFGRPPEICQLRWRNLSTQDFGSVNRSISDQVPDSCLAFFGRNGCHQLQ
jgi:hypothetical protein